ncbi:MAG: bifunctional riboflavin kinase/FAD synthetase [Leptolyngbyaceae bacterium]|nr:bifunctional riboflavin kinase/FAD synthetase [Leptolyngbyaceae bacterium]
MWLTSSLTTALTPTTVALGNFDGVHRGHQQVIQPALNLAAATVSLDLSVTQVGTTGTKAFYKTVVTFNPHPQEFFTGQARRLLTPLDEKVLALEKLGVEQLVLLPFDRELAALTPQAFVETILVQQLQAKHISVGADFCFGRQRAGTAVDLEAIAALHGIETTIVPLQTYQGERISSSTIRQALQSGDLQTANQHLGRPYSLIGTVVQGQQLGRTIGFPTANLQLPEQKFIPRHGVYAVRVHLESGDHQHPLLGVMNIGNRPTLAGTHQTIEIHLRDWWGDLYGQTLIVNLEGFLRPEQKFASLEELKAQIQVDCEAAKAILMASANS